MAIQECGHDVLDRVRCEECGREWCDICDPTPGPRCLFEDEHTQPDPVDWSRLPHLTHGSGADSAG